MTIKNNKIKVIPNRNFPPDTQVRFGTEDSTNFAKGRNQAHTHTRCSRQRPKAVSGMESLPPSVSCKPPQTDCSVGGDRTTPSGDLVSYTRLPGRQSHLKKGQNKKRAAVTQPTTRKTNKKKKEGDFTSQPKGRGFWFRKRATFFTRHATVKRIKKKKRNDSKPKLV